MKDYMIRGTAADGMIRCFAITARQSVEEYRKAHEATPVVTAAVGRVLCGAAMMGAMMKGEKDLLTIQIKGEGPIRGISVTADSQGHVKGFAYEPQLDLPLAPNGKLAVGAAVGPGRLVVIKDLGMKEPYVGQTDLQTGEIAEDLTYYFVVSEQTPSSVGLGVLVDRDYTVKQAGGFILQLMPDITDELIEKLEEKIVKIKPVTTMLEEGMSPEDILTDILGDMDLQIMDKTEVMYRCDCSEEKVSKAIASIDKKDIQEMIDDNEPIEVKCQFCNKKYIFNVEQLKEMLV